MWRAAPSGRQGQTEFRLCVASRARCCLDHCAQYDAAAVPSRVSASRVVCYFFGQRFAGRDSMIDRMEEVPTKDGTMETFIAHPGINGPHPAIIVYMDIWGVREELFDIARNVASVGYYV